MSKRRWVFFICLTIFNMTLIMSGMVTANAEPVFKLVYVIGEGDNLYNIAKKFETSISRLQEANNLTNTSRLLPGDELFIPFADMELGSEEVEWPDATLFSDPESEFRIMKWEEYSVRLSKDPIKINVPKSQRLIYHVQRGDSLYTLAKEFRTTVSVIKALNNMESSTIRIGQKLILPTVGLTQKQVLARTISAQELNLLARIVHGEARGEPYLGKVAVAAVVLNRVLSRGYPSSVTGVIYQRGQFESVSNGQFNLQPSSSALRAAREALSGIDPTMGALYFINPKYAPNAWWFDRRQKTVTIGDHVFAK